MAKESAKKDKSDAEMLPEYDFSKGTRGKYAQRYAAGTNVVVLDPDVAEMFGSSQEVNDALRMLVKLARRKPVKAAAQR